MHSKQIRLLILLMLGAVLVVGQLYVTLPLTPMLASRWQVTLGQAAWAGSAFGFSYAAGFLLLGRLSDRYGRRNALLWSLLATAVASVLVAVSTHFGMLLGARALQGLMAAGFPPAALALVAEALPPARRPLGLSLMSFAFLAAAPAAQFLAAQFAAQGLPAIMLSLAAAYGLLALGLYRLLPAAAAQLPHVAATATTTVTATASVPLWRQTQLMGVWLASLTVLYAFVVFHAGAQATGLAASELQALRLAGLPPLLLSIAAAQLVSRIGTVATARAGLVLAAMGLLLGLGASLGWLLVASVLLSAGMALAVPGLIGTVANRAVPSSRAQAIALYTFFLFVGASVAAPAVQALAPLGWTALLLTPIAALLCAAVVVNGWAFSHSRLQPSKSRSL